MEMAIEKISEYFRSLTTII